MRSGAVTRTRRLAAVTTAGRLKHARLADHRPTPLAAAHLLAGGCDRRPLDRRRCRPCGRQAGPLRPGAWLVGYWRRGWRGRPEVPTPGTDRGEPHLVELPSVVHAILRVRATVGTDHEAKVTADGAKVTFSRVRVTRMPPIPTVGTDEGDVQRSQGDADPVCPDRGNRRG